MSKSEKVKKKENNTTPSNYFKQGFYEPNADWIDVSITIKNHMVHWPDDPPVLIERILDMESGSNCNLSVASMSLHTGTHVDAPYHFLKSGVGIDQIPITAIIGLARVIEIKNQRKIEPKELHLYNIGSGERILFKTRNSERCWKTGAFVKDFVYLSTEAAQFLVSKKVQTVGIDYLSIGGYKKNETEVHRLLLEAGIWIIEGLNLAHVEPGIYELICLPLKIEQGDGAPARAILRAIQKT